MNNQARRLVLGFTVILACMAGLLAVSALVPEVGCKDSPSNYLLIGSRINLSVPKEVNPGQSFSINGTLQKASYNTPLIMDYKSFPQQKITLNVAMHTSVLYTDNAGNFTAEFTINTPGIYQVNAKYDGDRMLYYDESRANKLLTVTGMAPDTADYTWLIYVAIAAAIAILGYLLYIWFRHLQHSRADRRAGLNIVTKPKKKYRQIRPWLVGSLTIMVITGILFALWPRYQFGVRHEFNPAYLITRMEIKAPIRAKPGKPFTITGTLVELDEGKELPMSEQPIHIMQSPQIGTSVEIAILLTDENGLFSSEIILENKGVFEIAAVFNDTNGIYYESSDSRNVIVGNLPSSLFSDWNSPGWLTVMIVTSLVILLSLAVYLYYRRYRINKQNKEKQASGKKVIAASIKPDITHPVHTTIPPISIAFPQIPEFYPDVWGRDDDLLIVFSVDGTPQLLAQYSLDIEFGIDAVTRASLSSIGRAMQTHTFRQAGVYNIQAVLVKEVRNGYLPASRMVRIVDYREEIVRLYNEMLLSLKSQGLSLTPKMTAREVEIRLRKGSPSLSSDISNTLVSVFEEANYSLHPIARSAYEKMFKAVQQVVYHVRK
jgi:hypothetical protein